MANGTKVIVRNINGNGKKKRGRGRKQFTLPLAVVAGLAPAAIDLWDHRNAGAQGFMAEVGRIFTGWDYWSASWNPALMRWGTIPIVAGGLIHMGANKLGLNRMIARAGVPFIRI